MTDEAKEFLIEKGTNTDYGARPLRRAIEQHLEDSLSEALLRGEFHGKDTISIRAEGEGENAKLIFDTTKTDVVPAEPVAVAAAKEETVPAATA